MTMASASQATNCRSFVLVASVSEISLMVSGQSATFRSRAQSPCGASSSSRRASLILSYTGAYLRFSPAGFWPEIGFSRSLRRGMGFVHRVPGGNLQRAHLQQRKLLAVHQQHLLSERNLVAALRGFPDRRVAPAHGVVGMAERERSEHGHQHFAQFAILD